MNVTSTLNGVRGQMWLCVTTFVTETVVVRLSLVLSSTTGSSSSRYFREMSTLLSSACSEFCSNDLDSTKRRKYFAGFHAREAITDFRGIYDSNPIPQKLTLVKGWPDLKCLHGKKLALLGGLPYQIDRANTIGKGYPSKRVPLLAISSSSCLLIWKKGAPQSFSFPFTFTSSGWLWIDNHSKICYTTWKLH